MSNEHGSQERIKVDSSVAVISIKNFPICLHVMYLYFLDMIINDDDHYPSTVGMTIPH